METEKPKLTLADILEGLKNSDPEIRKKYLLVLARIDKPQIVKYITPLLEDESDEIRTVSQKLINHFNDKYHLSSNTEKTQENSPIIPDDSKSSDSPNSNESNQSITLTNDLPSTKIEIQVNANSVESLKSENLVEIQQSINIINDIKSTVTDVKENSIINSNTIESSNSQNLNEINQSITLTNYLPSTKIEIQVNTATTSPIVETLDVVSKNENMQAISPKNQFLYKIKNYYINSKNKKVIILASILAFYFLLIHVYLIYSIRSTNSSILSNRNVITEEMLVKDIENDIDVFATDINESTLKRSKILKTG
jgi:hypothetical protein